MIPDRRIVLAVAVALVAIVVVVALVIGVREAMLAAGLAGAAVGGAVLRGRVSAGVAATDATTRLADRLPSIPAGEEADARDTVDRLSTAEKVKRGNDLLGGRK